MTVKKYISILILLLTITSCNHLYLTGDECFNSKSPVGRYENIYHYNVRNILVIKENGTFEQIYQKGGEIKTNTGEWKFNKEDCSIHLKDLKLLHDLPERYRVFFQEDGIYKLNKIMFYEDLRQQFDFYPID